MKLLHRSIIKTGAFALLLPAAFTIGACRLPLEKDLGAEHSASKTDGGAQTGPENDLAPPSIEISPPLAEKNGPRAITGDVFSISVAAPQAVAVDLFYRPVAGNRTLKLRTLTSAAESGRFSAEFATPKDFNGEIWAEARYAGGAGRASERLRLFALSEHEKAKANDDDGAPRTSDDNESARSDRKTGGRVGTADLRPGAGDISITINVPAFLLTVWQNEKELRTFYVGVGKKDFPIPSGQRAAREIILNPDWIPPDSKWVREAGIEPLERIPAASPDNPLGKIKIPLGDAYLLHEAQGASDIGNLVSHGCVRVLREDLFELARLVIEARGLSSISNKELAAAKKNSERRVIALDDKLPVDINYDTMVVEGGVLHIYPDIYEQKTNTVEELRAELEGYKIDVSKLDESVLKKMLESVTAERKFVIALDDIRAGRADERGRTEPLTHYQAKSRAKKHSVRKSSAS